MGRSREWVCEMQDEQLLSSPRRYLNVIRGGYRIISVSRMSQYDWWQALSDLEGAFFLQEGRYNLCFLSVRKPHHQIEQKGGTTLFTSLTGVFFVVLFL